MKSFCATPQILLYLSNSTCPLEAKAKSAWCLHFTRGIDSWLDPWCFRLSHADHISCALLLCWRVKYMIRAWDTLDFENGCFYTRTGPRVLVWSITRILVAPWKHFAIQIGLDVDKTEILRLEFWLRSTNPQCCGRQRSDTWFHRCLEALNISHSPIAGRLLDCCINCFGNFLLKKDWPTSPNCTLYPYALVDS